MLDDFREWLSDNLRYILLGLAVVLIVVIGFCVVKLLMGSSDQEEEKTQQVSTEQVQMTETSETEGVTEGPAAEGNSPSGAEQGSASLTLNDTAILTLVKKYYAAVTAKDITTLESIVSPWDDEVKTDVLRNDGVIESYNNVSTYSKKGLVDNSYVVFVYFEGKVVNIETLVPSLSMLYLTTDASGNLIVADWNSSQEVADYIEEVRSDADVQALVADVNAQYEQAMEKDPALKAFMDSAGSEEGQAEGQSTAAVTTGEMEVTADAINIRQQPNTSSAIMGMVVAGTTVTVTELAEDGWCKITYNSSAGVIEGYVKQEYLAVPGSTGTGTV